MIDLEKVRALAQILKENDLSALELSSGEDRIRLKRLAEPCAVPAYQTPPPAAAPAFAAQPQKPAQAERRFDEVKSPMVGVFYTAASPDAEPYVKVGGHVKKGDTLCIIEAMKLMNEINAERDGRIVEICAENGEVVEYGQTLFKIK